MYPKKTQLILRINQKITEVDLDKDIGIVVEK